MKVRISAVFVFLFLLNTNAQNIKAILEGCEKHQLNKEQLINEISYTLYEDFTSNRVLEKLSGISVKFKDRYYTKIGLTEFVFNSEHALKISNNEKVIIISKISPNDRLMNFDMTESLLDFFVCENIKDKDGVWECSFIPKRENSKEQHPYTKCVLYIEKDNFQMLKQTLYFSKPINHNYKDKEQYVKNQRLEIDFKKTNKNIDFFKEKTLISNYVSLEGDEYKAQGKINDYLVVNAITQDFN